MHAPDFHAQVLTEEFAAMVDPLKAFRMACDSGAVEATAKAFRKMTIQEVCATVRQLLEDCDGDSSIVLQECLEALEADRMAIEGIMDEEYDEECHAHSQFGMGA